MARITNFDVFNRFAKIGRNTHFFSPSIGINYGFLKRKQLKLKANAGINYNYPTFNDLYWSPWGNIDLKPEQAEMVEFGISYDYKIKKTEVTMKYY